MVLAPMVADPTNRGAPSLQNAPLLYGGGGGTDIYGDLWAYDSTGRVWYPLEVSVEAAAATSIITSLLFGTVGFALYTCIIVCVFMRKVARSRRQLGQLGDLEQAGGAPGGRQPRRGLPNEAIDALPRLSWSTAR
eukprot:4006618-Prymnesium_polylepis.1